MDSRQYNTDEPIYFRLDDNKKPEGDDMMTIERNHNARNAIVGLVIGAALIGAAFLLAAAAPYTVNEAPTWASYGLVEVFPPQGHAKQVIWSATKPRTRGVKVIVTEGEKVDRTKVEYIMSGRVWRVISF